MKAWTIKQPGSRSQLVQIEIDKPDPKAGELLVEVKAAGVNRTDIILRQNPIQQPPYPILGIEISGIVVENHSNDDRFEPGTRIAGLVNLGGFAEYAVLPADRAIILPNEISLEEGAGIPEVFLTAYQTLYWEGALQPGESVLIHAGGSGVGTAATQLAHHLSNAMIIATAGQSEKLILSKQLGADVVVNYKTEDFAAIVNNMTNGNGVDVILDFVGASYWEKNWQSAAVDGRWVLIGTLGGAEVSGFSLGKLFQKRLTLTATLLTPRSDNYKARLTQEFMSKVMPLFDSGKITPIIHTVVSFDALPEAHRMMEANENLGKIIVKIAD